MAMSAHPHHRTVEARLSPVPWYDPPPTAAWLKSHLSDLDERTVFRNFEVALLTPPPDRMASRVFRTPMRSAHSLEGRKATETENIMQA